MNVRPQDRIRFCLFAVAAAGSVLIGCQRQAADSSRHRPPPRPNIVFVLIDTLRADRLGAYGHAGGNSPNIDAIAAESVIFERAIAPSPWTQPSIASLFAGCCPGVHKVLDYQQAHDAEYGDAPKIAVFADSFDTLAESLQGAGYATAGFVANVFIRAEYGFAQGFEHFDSSFASNVTAGDVVTDAALAWLDGRDDARPFFVYLHYMDAHGPYTAGPRFLDPLLDRVEQRPDKQALTPIQMERLGYLRALPPEHTDPARHQRLGRYRQYWEARYEAGIRKMDEVIGELRAELDRRGLWDDAYVIIAADHGEALCEHDLWGHGYSCHHTDLHVPMILRWSNVLPAGKRVSGPVRLIDLPPTILDQLGLAPLGRAQGASLRGRIGGYSPRAAVAFAEGVKRGPEQKAVYLGKWKLLFTVKAGTYQLYDLASDPLEQNDLAARPGSPLAAMTGILQRQLTANERLGAGLQAEHVTVSGEELQRLRALGYVD